MQVLKKILLILVLVVASTQVLEAQQKKKQSKGKSTKKTTTTQSGATKKVNSNDAEDAAAKLEREALADTSNPKEVVITSAFKPSLKNAAKINFTAASTLTDTSRLQLLYKVPAQNLFFSYQPVPIKPIAIAMDSLVALKNDHFVKLGIGNFSTPYAEVGLSFGDGRNSIVNIHASHVSSNGQIDFQEFSKTGIDVFTQFINSQEQEWTAKAFYKNSKQYLYGFQPSTLSYTKDDLLQRFNTIGFELGFRNKLMGVTGILYHPQISLINFSSNNHAKEMNLIAKFPFSKSFGKFYSFDVGLNADIATYNAPLIPNPIKIQNNLFTIDPNIRFKTPNFLLTLGVTPSWDNTNFKMLPNFGASAKIKETGLLVELGWKGYFQKNSYRSLAEFNPFLDKPDTIRNTRISEQYLGVKGSLGNHFSMGARLSFMQLFNQPLFVNTFSDGRAFNILYDSKIESIQIHGEIGYRIQEQFSVIGGININQYTSLSNYSKAYGLIPIEITGSFKWKIWKDLQIKSEIYLRDGSPYQGKSFESFKLDPAADLNLGAEFSVLPKLNIWLQMNNLLNNTYQRWNQYQVMGFNVLGGVVYSF